jgi:transcription elongation factor Elf1
MDTVFDDAIYFDCPICKQGTVSVLRRHVIRSKFVARCGNCDVEAEFWDPHEAEGYFKELAEYFNNELTILRGK